MSVTTRWTPFTTDPIIGTATYPEDIDTRNQEMASRMEEIDDIGQEMNDVADDINIKEATVVEKEALVSPHYDNIDIIGENIEDINAVGSAMIDSTNPAVKLNSSAYGYTKKVSKADRWLETDTPNVIVDKLGDDVRFSDGLYSRLGDDGIENGDFSNGTTGWTGITSVVNGKGLLGTDGTVWAYQVLDDTKISSGKTYKIKISYFLVDGDYKNIRIGDGSTGTNGSILVDSEASGAVTEDLIYIITATSNALNIAVLGNNAESYIDNISVKELPQVGLDDAPFTSVNANDTDETIPTGDTLTNYTHISGNIVIAEDNPNDIYQCIVTSSDIGEDITSSGDFQAIDRVTRKDLVLITKTGYTTVKGIYFFDANESNDVIASAYGYSKLGNGLYHDGTEEVIIAGLVDRLNAKMYNPIYNSSGSYQNSDDEYWYEETSANTSIYDVFDTAVNTTSGRPDGKVEDIVYYSSNGGIIAKPTYSQQANEHDLLASESNIELDMAESVSLGTEQFLQTTTGTVATIEVADGTLYKEFRYINIYDVTATTLKGRYQIESIDSNELTLTTTLSKSANQYLISGLQSPYNLTQGETLDAVATCDPQYLPSDWLIHLDGGYTIDIIMNTYL